MSDSLTDYSLSNPILAFGSAESGEQLATVTIGVGVAVR